MAKDSRRRDFRNGHIAEGIAHGAKGIANGKLGHGL